MTQPTEQLLKDPAWWDENCEPWAQLVAIENDARGGFELMHQRASAHGSMISVKHPDNDLTFYERPEPQSQEWDGEGLPPVGGECECTFAVEQHDTWHKGRVVFSGIDPEGREFFIVDTKTYQACYRSLAHVRPLRTKEQRDRDELLEIIYMNEPSEVIADAILAAGWRKGAE